MLSDLITAEIEPLIIPELWAAASKREEAGQARIKLVADNWGKVVHYLENGQ